MITNDRAVEKLKVELLTRVTKAGFGFRIYHYPDPSGQCKLALKLDTIKNQDVTIDCQGVRLMLDPDHALQLKNLELDYDESPTGGFFLKQP